jgi:Zn ribbon nucleic-acid-binding protein
MKDTLKLTKEEKAEHDTLVKGGYHSIPNLEEEKKKMSLAAQNTLKN